MEKKNPYFFKIVVGDYLKHRVRIPPAFMKHLSEDMSHKTTVKATIKVAAECWPVKLRKTTTDTYLLEGGWQKVMEDNLLDDNQVLLFRYDGDMCFNLQIFEKSGCERIYPPAVFVGEKYQEEHKEQYDDDDDDNDEKSAADRKETLSFSSQSPHFKTCMKYYHVQKIYTFRIPARFSKTHFPGSEKKRILLENSKGEAWEVNAVPNGGTYWLCGGWRVFVHANKLKCGDNCIFEFLGKEKMRVYKE